MQKTIEIDFLISYNSFKERETKIFFVLVRIMPTIYDIAKKTGYSASTVSKALNDYENISEKAKERILEVAKELNYIPNASARGLMTKRSNMVGLLTYEYHYHIMLHSHLSEILNSFKDYVESKGYDVLFVNTKSYKNNLTYYEQCKYRSLDGVLIAIGDIQFEEPKRKIEEIVNSELPKVSVDSIYENSTNVLCDNYDGALKVMDYLLFLGHKKIAFVDAYYSGSAGKERFKAYKDFMAKNEKFDEDLIYKANGFSRENGNEIAKEILKKGFSNLPTAIFCICDEVALGVMEYFEKHGVRVPDDVSIVGFDDIKASEYFGLTTIRQDREKIGQVAGKKLIEAIEGEQIEELILTEIELIVRNSCRSIKG